MFLFVPTGTAASKGLILRNARITTAGCFYGKWMIRGRDRSVAEGGEGDRWWSTIVRNELRTPRSVSTLNSNSENQAKGTERGPSKIAN